MWFGCEVFKWRVGSCGLEFMIECMLPGTHKWTYGCYYNALKATCHDQGHLDVWCQGPRNLYSNFAVELGPSWCKQVLYLQSTYSFLHHYSHSNQWSICLWKETTVVVHKSQSSSIYRIRHSKRKRKRKLESAAVKAVRAQKKGSLSRDLHGALKH